MDYLFKTQPYGHQLYAFNESRDLENYAELWEMGTGKSKLNIDTAAWLHSQGKIQCLLIVAPKGVHRNWITKEVPVHMPDWITTTCCYWVATPRAAEKKIMAKVFTDDATNLRVISINYDALIQKKGRQFVEKVLTMFKTMMVLDESQRIKSADAKRTRAAITLGKKAVYRRILSGTPVPKSPLDLYMQYKFLDPTILKWTTFSAFRAHHAVIRDQWDPLVVHIMKQNNLRRAPILIAEDENGKPMYKNIPELKQRIAPYTSIALKEDCLDLPEKVFMQIPVELSDVQRRAYRSMIEDAVADLRTEFSDKELKKIPADPVEAFEYMLGLDGSGVVKASNGMVKQLRLQQLIGGYPTDGENETIPFDKIPKLDKMIETIKFDIDPDARIIIWSCFRAEIQGIVDRLNKEFPVAGVVEYHGGVLDDDREEAIYRLQGERPILDDQFNKVGTDTCPDDHRARFFVGQQHAGGLGITLTAATYVFYYANNRSGEDRQQSEDRAHRIGQEEKVTIVDFITENTIESKILAEHEVKRELSREIMT